MGQGVAVLRRGHLDQMGSIGQIDVLARLSGPVGEFLEATPDPRFRLGDQPPRDGVHGLDALLAVRRQEFLRRVLRGELTLEVERHEPRV